MNKVNYISIFEFDNWNEVTDYESDEYSVILYDKNHEKIAEFGYSGFTAQDFENFKNKK